MRARHLAAASAAFLLALAAAASAQELSFSLGAGGFFPTEKAYRLIYGSSLPVAGDVWLKTRGPLGLAAGFGWTSDEGVAVPTDGGEATYPVAFRRTSIPVIVFYQLDAGAVAIRLGAGAGFHGFRESWQTADLDFKGHLVSPRIVLAASVALLHKLSFFCSASYDSIRTGAGSPLAGNIDLGGFQLLGGLAFRIF